MKYARVYVGQHTFEWEVEGDLLEVLDGVKEAIPGRFTTRQGSTVFLTKYDAIEVYDDGQDNTAAEEVAAAFMAEKYHKFHYAVSYLGNRIEIEGVCYMDGGLVVLVPLWANQLPLDDTFNAPSMASSLVRDEAIRRGISGPVVLMPPTRISLDEAVEYAADYVNETLAGQPYSPKVKTALAYLPWALDKTGGEA